MPAVDVSTSGDVCRITLNRPEKLNALNDDVRRELHDAFTQLADDTEVRVVVLEGAGRAFSAGADLAAGGAGGQTWADADLLAWSLREPEGRQAAAAYVEKRLRKNRS
jgi:enoyl-CoA hydratase/carnithine racemase